MSPGRKLLYTSTCTGESRQNHTACRGAHQWQDKCPPTAEGGGSCSSTVTGSASLTLSFSVARISSLLKKETEGSECQQAKATLQPAAGAAPASLGARQDLLDTCPVLGAELLPGQLAAPPRRAFLPPRGWGAWAPHLVGKLALSLPYGPPKGGFQWRGADVQDVHLGKAGVNAANLPGGNRESVPAQACSHPSVLRSRQGKGRVQAGQGCMRGAHVSLSCLLLLLVTKVVVAEVGHPAVSRARNMILVQLKTDE